MPLLELQNVQKRFGGVTALRDASLTVHAGQVHLLLGENGAGKSTLMKIVAGIVERDSGRMLWNGQEVFLRTPSEAAAMGIAMVNQESLLAPHLSVAENIFLGREEGAGAAGPFGWVNRRAIVEKARALITQYGFPLEAEWPVSKLSPAGRQMVEICRAIHHGSSVLIFDEPTSSLSDTETEQVFRIVRDLKARGMGIIYITHRMNELRAIGDAVTVLRDGETAHAGRLADIATDRLIEHMVGREVAQIYQREHLEPGEPMLEVRNLSVKSSKLANISLTLRRGEITGMAGLIGAGRTELCRAIFGIDKPDAGEILVDGKPVRIRSPREAVQAGIALVTEDRQISGLALRLPIGHNVTMANMERISRFGFLDLKEETRVSGELGRKMSLKAASPAQLAGTLSGGNQQKVVIAKWLFRQSRIFLFDEPTRGIDIGAKAEVFELMGELARSGAAILMVSSELTELQHVADRIVVMRQGRISGELPRGSSQEQMMKLAVMEAAPAEVGA
jgi:ABC-type sugar transport system ATPase subunit